MRTGTGNVWKKKYNKECFTSFAGGRIVARKIAIGIQDFAKIRENHTFLLIKQNLSENGGIVGMMSL